MLLTYIIEIAIIIAGLCVFIDGPAEDSSFSFLEFFLDVFFDLEHFGVEEMVVEDIHKKRQEKREKKRSKEMEENRTRTIVIKGRQFRVAKSASTQLAKYNECIWQYNHTSNLTFLHRATDEVTKIYRTGGFLQLSKEEEDFIMDWVRTIRKRYTVTKENQKNYPNILQ